MIRYVDGMRPPPSIEHAVSFVNLPSLWRTRAL